MSREHDQPVLKMRNKFFLQHNREQNHTYGKAVAHVRLNKGHKTKENMTHAEVDFAVLIAHKEFTIMQPKR